MTTDKLTYEQLQDLVFSELVDLGLWNGTIVDFRGLIGYTARALEIVLANYFLNPSERYFEVVEEISSQYRNLEKVGWLDVQEDI